MLPFMGCAGRQFNGTIEACSFSGTLTGSGAGPTVTGTQRTVTVGANNSGAINITAQAETGTVNFEYSKNGGAWTAGETDPTALSFVTGDTIQFRITSATSGEEYDWQMYDVSTATTIGSYTLVCS